MSEKRKEELQRQEEDQRTWTRFEEELANHQGRVCVCRNSGLRVGEGCDEVADLKSRREVHVDLELLESGLEAVSDPSLARKGPNSVRGENVRDEIKSA